ncbi:MAG TPA: hemolysin family protein [Cyclobacteriaceae bacterium]
MALDILFTLFLVFLNGFFVAAEFAIVKVRSSQIALQSGTPSKRAALAIINNLDGFLAATQLGITLASLGLGWVGEDVVSVLILRLMHVLGFEPDSELAHNIALPVAFVIITILHIVFGELAPKSLAIRHPTSTALKVSLPLRFFYFVFKPFIALLNGFAIILLKAVGIKPAGEHAVHTEEELKLIIAESEEGGAIESSERELIQNVFEFDNRVVKQIMVPRIKISGLPAATSLEEAVSMIFNEGYTRYPVYDKNLDDIVGVIHAKDVFQAYWSKSAQTLTALARKPYYITENKPIDELLREFQRTKNQMAIVVNEYGGTVGIVTLEDILEEIVGEIQDEHDQEIQIVTRVGNVYKVVATSAIHDINKIIEHPLPESTEYDTLSGLLVMYKPFDLKEGDELELFSYRIRILKLNRSLPELVELQYIGPPEQ